MKFRLLLFFSAFIKISECSVEVSNKTGNILSFAVKDLATERVRRMFNNIKIVCSMSEKGEIESSDFITNFISELDSDMKVSMGFTRNPSDFQSRQDSLVLVIIESLESFKIIEEKLLGKSYMDKFYLLIPLNGVFVEIDEIFKRFWIHWIYNVNVLSEENDGKIFMHTFFPFTKESCGDEVSLTLINQFDSATRLWSTNIYFPEKFTNLNACPLKVAVLGANPPSVLIESSESSEEKNFSGFEVDIIKEIVEEFNVSFQFEEFEIIGTVYTNGSILPGMLPSLYAKHFDLALGTLSLQYDRLQFLSASKSFASVPVIIVAPPASVISAFQKLIQPFTVPVWVSFMTLFLIGFAVTVALRIAPKGAYNFIVGRGVKNPFFNMLIAFFGDTQRKLPATNFARFLLMNFLLFCLVIPCIYQGKLFIMLEAELHEKEVETIHDAIDRNMVFYTYESLSSRITGLKFSDRCEI